MKKISIGYDDFRRLRENKERYYIDKSLFLKDVIDNESSVCLITRPRRFGKTLNMSMLYHYFNIDEESKELFEDLQIMKEDKKYTDKLNNVPVIFISFNGIKPFDYDDFTSKMKERFARTYRNFRYLLDSEKIEKDEKNYILDVLNRRDYEMSTVLSNLCEFLYKHYDKLPIILIDEYDVPLQESYTVSKTLFDSLKKFFSSLFDSTFKTNPYVLKTIITGNSRITKEGIFTGANNFNVYTVLDSLEFSDDFGFTESEVFDALKYFNLEDEKENIKKYYDGYKIGDINDIYNPWSILNFLEKKKYNTYWMNTSSNDIIYKIVEKNTYMDIKDKLVKLLNDEAIEVFIDDEVSINNIDEDINNIWSLLLGSGYLKVVNTIDYENKIYTVKIPNKEVMIIFKQIVNRWFRVDLKGTQIKELLNDLINLNIEEFEEKFKEMVITMFSYFDVPDNDKGENFYHAFTLGLVTYLKDDYYITSNRESGYGRYDILLEAKENKPSFILEFKLKKNYKNDNQIDDKKYDTELKMRGKTDIHKFIFVFDGKKVDIKPV